MSRLQSASSSHHESFFVGVCIDHPCVLRWITQNLSGTNLDSAMVSKVSPDKGSDPKNFWDASCHLKTHGMSIPKLSIVDSCRHAACERSKLGIQWSINPQPSFGTEAKLGYRTSLSGRATTPFFSILFLSSHIKLSCAAIQNLFLTCMSGQSTARSTLLELTTSSAASWSPLQGLFFGHLTTKRDLMQSYTTRPAMPRCFHGFPKPH